MVIKMSHTKDMMTVEADGITMRMVPTPVGAHGEGSLHSGTCDAGSQRHGSDAHAD